MTNLEAPSLPGYSVLPEPRLLYHPGRQEDNSVHPLDGLLRFGPYGRSLLHSVLDPIVVAIVAPHNEGSRVELLLGEFDRLHQPRERQSYLRPFPGFPRVFGVRVIAGGAGLQLELPRDLDQRLATGDAPHLALAEALIRSIEQLDAKKTEFAVAFVYLPDRWQHAFRTDDDDFDLHDYVKAFAAGKGIAVQFLNEGSALKYSCRCSVMWRLGIATYCKAGGTPWTVADIEEDTAFLGISYALRKAPVRGGRFVTCCSLVFDAEGSGPEFVLFEVDPHFDGHNPFLSRDEMRSVILRSLELYRRRHAGRSPARVVVHKTTQFTRQETAGCHDALRPMGSFELLQVQDYSSWKAVHLEARAKPGKYPCRRGTFLPFGGHEVLLWTQGDVKGSVTEQHYFKEGKGIPAPLLLRRFAGHGGWEATCRAVLSLTKMNWNNDSLYDRLPVTLAYAGVLARTVKRLPEIRNTPYQLRFFM